MATQRRGHLVGLPFVFLLCAIVLAHTSALEVNTLLNVRNNSSLNTTNTTVVKTPPKREPTTNSNGIVIIPCYYDADCSGHGKCLADRATGDYVCHCVNPWKGASCSKRDHQETCGGLLCLNGGTCHMSKCMCPHGFVGKDCGIRDCPFSDHLRCAGNGKCIIPPHNQPATNLSVDPVALARLTKVPGKGDQGVCYCANGWIGPACDMKPCPTGPGGAQCSYNGVCQKGHCKCNPGFSGHSCERRACPDDCSGRGTCDTKTFTCACPVGYAGVACERVLCPSTVEEVPASMAVAGIAAAPGAGSTSVSMLCGGRSRGECNFGNGTCSCSKEWTGTSCQTEVCTDKALKGCSGHGRCELQKCVCDLGFIGKDCSRVGCKLNCLRSAGHGACVDDKCQCFPGYSGAYCQLSRPVPQPCGNLCYSNCSRSSACKSPPPAVSSAAAMSLLEEQAVLGASTRNRRSLRSTQMPLEPSASLAVSPTAKVQSFAAECVHSCAWKCIRGCFALDQPQAQSSMLAVLSTEIALRAQKAEASAARVRAAQQQMKEMQAAALAAAEAAAAVESESESEGASGAAGDDGEPLSLLVGGEAGFFNMTNSTLNGTAFNLTDVEENGSEAADTSSAGPV